MSEYFYYSYLEKNMKKKSVCTIRLLSALFLVLLFGDAIAQQGLVRLKSSHDVAATADRLESVLAEKGMKVFARIDHAAGAAGIGETLAPMEVVIFGNPKVGTGLMKCAASAGIDLPMKALVWQDADGDTWLGYNDSQYLAERHGMSGCDALLENVAKALNGFATAATGS
jgi:uncharacterized protein (DUF302 family)